MSKLQGSIIITGANGGLGNAIVGLLQNSPQGSKYQGIYTVRDPETANDLKAVLAKGNLEHRFEILALDLASLESIRRFAADINNKVANGMLQPIQGVILNAAWQDANPEALKPQFFTKEGFEGNFGINYLANFLLVLLLLQSIDKDHGRIIGVGSYTHDPYDGRNDFLRFFEGDEYKEVFKSTESLAKGITYNDNGYNAGMRRYGASKTLMVMFMYELQRRLNSDPDLSKISVMTLDPGGMKGTSLTKNTNPPEDIKRVVGQILSQPHSGIRTPEQSGADLLRALFNVDILGEHPKNVYLDGSLFSESSTESKDEKKQKQLWADSIKLAKVEAKETALKDLY